MTQSPFEAATSLSDDGGLLLSEDWTQGRGIYGGIPAAAMVRSMEGILDRPECVLRSLTVHFCAPLMPGAAEVKSSAIRVGSRVAHMSSTVTQSGVVTNHATASFGAVRPVDLDWDETVMPDVPSAAAVPSVAIELFGGPRFSQFFDYRFAGDSVPMSSADTARLRTWIRPSGSPVMDTAHVIGILDAGAPGILSRLAEPRPMASVDFRIQLFSEFPLVGVDPNAHWLLDAHARVLTNGYCEQLTWLFAPDGRAVGSCQQLIAVLG